MSEIFDWDGSFLIPARVVREARAGVAKADNPVPKLPTIEELTAFLELLGYLALGSRILFDGSIPSGFREETLGKVKSEVFFQRNLSRLDHSLEPFSSTSPDFEELLQDSATAATLLLDHLPGILEKPKLIGRSIKPDLVADFYRWIGRVAEEPDQSERIALAQEAFSGGVMGGKLILGLVGSESDQALRAIAAVPEGAKEGTLSVASTYFRSFLLSTWAPKKNALYSALPEQARVLEGHRLALWREIERALAKEGVFHSEVHDYQEVIPIMGAAVLSEAKPQDWPADLFDHAYELGRSWDVGEIQRGLVRCQIKGNQEGVEAAAKELAERLEDYGRRFRDPGKHGIVNAKHELLPAWTVEAVKIILDLNVPLVGSLLSLHKKKLKEPDRFIAYLWYGATQQLYLGDRLWDKVRQLWRVHC